ncbi:nicotinate-nucleotide adenylyltransferase [Bacillus shivajii]|uniref:nicotinate-nucleotide adenylyltransferase n=1 Tax=Bacillus shivajii TaxID=1983719 RepID=UPI001CFA8CD7|nr:nicotinate-nucleotide adenylyltransferase [Bacillus shivajii]UCZ54461.1 nicotinate-nucleotide adenylyltransferase [Bacillus shivajii]
MKKVGILGGTFDPPHIGHLLIAEQARLQMELDEVWWMPNRIPPHKKRKSDTSDEDRISLVSLMTKKHDGFCVCNVEFEREGPSFTVETIERLQKKHLDHTFYFIIGGDSLETLPTWHESERLQQLVSFIVIERPNYPFPKQRSNDHIHFVEGPTIDVSSSYIRENINTSMFNKFLLTDEVYKFIKELKLYE